MCPVNAWEGPIFDFDPRSSKIWGATDPKLFY